MTFLFCFDNFITLWRKACNIITQVTTFINQRLDNREIESSSSVFSSSASNCLSSSVSFSSIILYMSCGERTPGEGDDEESDEDDREIERLLEDVVGDVF